MSIKIKLSKKARAALENYIVKHGRFNCNIRRPYVVAYCELGNLCATGVGFSKWNPNDKAQPKWDYNEPRGVNIAVGRAIVDLVSQMDNETLAAYVESAYMDQQKVSA
jgi:hypothetical protein